MSRRRSFLIGAGILGGAVVVSYTMIAQRPDPPVREPDSPAPFVTTVPIALREGVIPVHSAGTVRPRAEIDVAAQVAGKVADVAPAFQSGGRVPAGKVLFRLDDADYRNRVRQARANVAAQLVALLEAQEEVRIARAEYEGFARRRGSSSGVPSPLALREPQLAAARAALARDSATLADAELALSRTEVRAPFGGVVRAELVDVGQFVAAGQSVGRLYAADAVEVVVPLTDTDAALIPNLWSLAAGDGVSGPGVTVTAEYGGVTYAWPGYLDRAEAALDEQTRMIDAVVRVPDPFVGGRPGENGGAAGPPLLVGQFVEVRIDGSAPGRYFTLPRAALRAGNEVWALTQDTLVTIVSVRVLQRIDDTVYAAAPLADGQAVVLGGLQFAIEGMAVRPRPAIR